MRQWFYLDKLSEQDRMEVKRWHLRVIGGYAAVSLALIAMIALQTESVQSQIASLATHVSATSAQAAGN